MTTRIDDTILSVLSEAGGRWRKVAMVISKVANAMGNDLPNGDGGYEQVAQRIEALVADGRLSVQGNIKNWRFSEVRLPQ
jgi:hypothetical protein